MNFLDFREETNRQAEAKNGFKEMRMSEREKDVKARYDSLASGDKARLDEEWRAQGVLQAPPRERLLRMDESLRRLGK